MGEEGYERQATSWTLSIDRVLLFCGALDGPTAMDTRDEDSMLLDLELGTSMGPSIG